MKKFFQKRDEYETKGRAFGLGGTPDADWKIMFSVFLTLFFIALVYSGITFINVMSGGFGSQMVDTADSPVDKNLLKKNALYYKNKKDSFELLKTTKETIPDPSI